MSTRVLMVEAGGWGGICHYTFALSGALAEGGVTVRLLSGSPYELADFDHAFDIRAEFDPRAPYLDKTSSVVRNIREFQPDVVHVQSTFSARRDWALYGWIRALGFPVVLTAHNIVPHDTAERSAPGMMLSYDLIYSMVDHIIVHGEGPREDMERAFRPDREKVSVIAHGDYTLFASSVSTEEARERVGMPQDKRIVLAFGAIREYKGVEELIEAFARCAVKNPDLYLAIVGKPIGVDVDTYRQRIETLGLSHRVYLKAEYIDAADMHLYLQASDIMAFPYRDIAQSGALQLAYAAGRPVLVTAVGAFPETVVHGENGLVVPPQDPEALAESLGSLAGKSIEVLRSMGERSRSLAESRHGWDEAARKTVAVYDGVRG